MRSVVWLLHKWAGISAGGVFALLGLTGSLLVFYPEIDQLLNPSIRVSATARTEIDVDAVHAVIRAAEPMRHGPWRIELPLTAGSPINARYYKPAETTGRTFAPLMLTLDPQTLALTSKRFWGDYVVTWLYDLHYSLLLDRNGPLVLGVIGILLVVLVALGIALWWPSPRRWRKALSIRWRAGGPRRNYDLHTVVAIWALPLTATLLVTGLVLAQPQWFKPSIQRISPLTPYYDAHTTSSTQSNVTPQISAATAIATARSLFPAARLRWVETPGDGHPAWRLQFAQPGEPGIRFPRTNVWIDSRSGKVIAVRDPRRNSGGDTFFDWLHPLHNGEAFGLAGRIAACIAGLLPSLAFVTGVIRWQQKRNARKRVRRTESQSLKHGT